VKRLNLLVKGNVDVHDSLIYSRVGGEIRWNGLNALVAQRHPDWVVRTKHEVCARWDHMGVGEGAPPRALVERRLPLGAFSPEAQFRSRLLDPADVIVLSVQADVSNVLLRHREEGYLFFPHLSQQWGPADVRWAAKEFESVGLTRPSSSMESLGHLCRVVRERSTATILVYNMSSYIPGERIHSHRGLGDSLSTRIRAYNLALIEGARHLPIFIVDVDRVFAEQGARRMKLDAFHWSLEGQQAIAAEVLDVLEHCGHFDGR
jgi:hypothetical protein